MLLALMSVPAAMAAYTLESNTLLCALACALFMMAYVALYACLVLFKWCSPIVFLFVQSGNPALKTMV
jgi:hypothetical protein